MVEGVFAEEVLGAGFVEGQEAGPEKGNDILYRDPRYAGAGGWLNPTVIVGLDKPHEVTCE